MKAKARAVVKSVAKHRVFFLFVIGLFTVGLLAGSYAIQSGASFSGQTQAGDHDWWSGFKADTPGGNQAFCENCHTAIASDISQGPHKSVTLSACSNCHTAGGNDHAAAAAACTDCHTNQANDLASTTEAHNGIWVGTESPTDASQTCQACHTHAEVAMTITADAPIPLQMGG